MSLSHYLQTHLAGSEGGVRLFARAARTQTAAPTRRVLGDIHAEILDERAWLRDVLEEVGGSPSRVLLAASVAGERLGRLVPHGSLLHRTAMTDLTELETMRTAVSGKLAGFEALVSVADHHAAIDADAAVRYRDQALDQLDRLAPLHREAAGRALG